MRTLALGVLLAASLASSALAAAYRITPAPAPQQVVSTVHDKPAMTSILTRGEVSLVLVAGVIDAHDYPQFIIAVRNKGDQPASLTAANIAVTTDHGGDRVLTVDELKQMARDDAGHAVRNLRREAYDEALQSGLANMPNISMPTIGGTGTLGTYVPAGATEARQWESLNAMQMAGDRRNLQVFIARAYAFADAKGFQPAVVAPGQTAFSPLLLDRLPKRATTLNLAVTLNGEAHVFAFNIAPDK